MIVRPQMGPKLVEMYHSIIKTDLSCRSEVYLPRFFQRYIARDISLT